MSFVGNIDDFWSDELSTHTYAREVPFVAKNFDHLDREYYNRDFLLQSFNEELPVDYKQYYTALECEEGSVSWTCILPNRILPIHQDTFYTLRLQKNVDVSLCFRYLVLLEDYVFGQYIQLGNTPVINWKKGDVWKFDSSLPHYAVNASNVKFHSCQVSTIKRD